MNIAQHPVQLVITVAGLREWPKKLKIPTYHLKSKSFSGPNEPCGVLLCVTGLGLEKSHEAALFIANTIRPLYVLNLGTCGSKKYPLNTWLHITAVKSRLEPNIELSDRLPFLWPNQFKKSYDTLLSIKDIRNNTSKRITISPDVVSSSDNIDMECYAQAKVFSQNACSFHALKYVSDDNSESKITQYNTCINAYNKSLNKILHFLDPTKKTVSVVIPTFNRATKVCRAIQSVLDQKSPAQEIIVVDDASTDKTLHQIEDLFGKHPLIKIIKHPKNLGVSSARNTGIQAAQSNWISFLDSDDYWTDSKLKYQRDYLTTYPFYTILQSEEIWIRNSIRVNPHKHHQKPIGWAFDVSLKRCLISPSSVLISTRVFEHFGNFNPHLSACEDYDLWLRILRHLPVGLSKDKTLVKTGGHADQLSKLPLLDLYRIKTLQKLFKEEHHPRFKKRIKATWLQKYSVLKQGAIKHNNIKLLEDLKTLSIL